MLIYNRSTFTVKMCITDLYFKLIQYIDLYLIYILSQIYTVDLYFNLITSKYTQPIYISSLFKYTPSLYISSLKKFIEKEYKSNKIKFVSIFQNQSQ